MKEKESEVLVLGYDIYTGNLKKELRFLGKEKVIVNTINAYSYVVAKQDEDFNQALKKSDILLPDGFPIVFAAKTLSQKRIKKIAGEDIFYHLLSEGNELNRSVFFLGASKGTLDKILSRLKYEFPNVKVGVFSPPFKTSFNEEENEKMIQEVNRFKPDILFVGMTAPKQEKWVEENKDKLRATIICSIGAVFDFYAGTVKRPSQFWISMNLEWFARLLKEPRRLWRRYFIYSPIFFIDVLKAKFKR